MSSARTGPDSSRDLGCSCQSISTMRSQQCNINLHREHLLPTSNVWHQEANTICRIQSPGFLHSSSSSFKTLRIIYIIYIHNIHHEAHEFDIDDFSDYEDDTYHGSSREVPWSSSPSGSCCIGLGPWHSSCPLIQARTCFLPACLGQERLSAF